jgi:hypothetical protein
MFQETLLRELQGGGTGKRRAASDKKLGGGRLRFHRDHPPPKVTDALNQKVYLSENCAMRGPPCVLVIVPKVVLLPMGLLVAGLLS